ncbi:MAG: hypothetical protein KJP17_09655 [Gammaproteobacteria bacterium]|nr:hypothetical protein [Gammaproteobacteria bacterium]
MCTLATAARAILTALLTLALIGSAAAQTERAKISKKPQADIAQKEARAVLLQERLGQMDLGPELELSKGDLAGSGLLLGFGAELLNQFKDQMNGFPGGEFSGVLQGIDGTGGDSPLSGARFKPAETAMISKDTSLISKGGAGDSRLMSGDTDTVYTITSSHSDYESSDGTQIVTETLTVTDDKGNSFSQTITHEKNSKDEVTETQTVTSTDPQGNTTSESSCTGKNCPDTESSSEDTGSEDTGSEDTGSGDASGDEDTAPAEQEGTPDPDGAECTGAGCEEFKAFSSSLLAALDKNRIEPQQDRDSMMQPGAGTKSPSGTRSDAIIEKAGKERLNPLILHDRAGGDSVPLPGPGGSEPLGQDPGTLVDPPDEGGTLPDDEESGPPRRD